MKWMISTAGMPTWNSQKGSDRTADVGSSLSAVIVGISFVLKQFFPPDFQTAGIILSITAISILMSLIPAVNKIKKDLPERNVPDCDLLHCGWFHG